MDERRRVSRSHERAAAKSLGTRVHRGSGSGSRRNDSSNDELLVENKTVLHGKKQITLQSSVLDDLVQRALISGRRSLAHIRLGGKNYVLLTEDEYLGMKNNL